MSLRPKTKMELYAHKADNNAKFMKGVRPERLRAFLSFWLGMREDYSRLVKIDNHHE